VRYVREQAIELGVSADRIWFMGSSAGGGVTATLPSTTHAPESTLRLHRAHRSPCRST
jgi:acetyl esterase/lipase